MKALPPTAAAPIGCKGVPFGPCDVETSRAKLDCVCRFGLSGGALLGTAGGGATSIEGLVVFEISTAVVGLSAGVSNCSIVARVGRLSDDLNLDDRLLADVDSFPLDRGGARASACGRGVFSCSSSSSGDVANEDVMMLPDDGNLGLCPNVPEPPPLGFVRCDRKDTDLFTLCPMSDTLEVKLSILLSLLCPLISLLLSLSNGTSIGGVNLPLFVSCGVTAGSTTAACFFPVNRPNTLVDDVEKEGIPAAGSDAICIVQTCLLSQPATGASAAGMVIHLRLRNDSRCDLRRWKSWLQF